MVNCMKEHSVKRKICVLPFFLMAALLLSGCFAKRNTEITKIYFNRRHDSPWGNQFYILITPAEIVIARYIPEGSQDLASINNLPITDTQWEMIKNTVEQLPFEKARTDIWKKQKIDGSNFRELTRVRGKKETDYWWPDTPEIQQLEQLL